MSGLIPVLATLLVTNDVDVVVITYSATILTKLAGARGFAEDAQKHGVYPALVHAVINSQPYDVLIEVQCTTLSVHSYLLNVVLDFMALEVSVGNLVI